MKLRKKGMGQGGGRGINRQRSPHAPCPAPAAGLLVSKKRVVLLKILSNPIPVMSLVSNNIKYLRKLNGLTQEQFSQRIGIKRSLLGAYEEARANPNWNTLITIAKLFNTSVDQLLKQDLRKIRETPDLSLPIGRNATPTRPSTPPIFEGDDADDDFISSPPQISDPVLPHTSAESSLQPQPLVNVLEKYYKPPTERAERQANPAERTQPDRAAPQPAPVGVLYEEVRARAGHAPGSAPAFTVSRGQDDFAASSEPLPTFNNHFEKAPNVPVAAQSAPVSADNSAQAIHYVGLGQFGEYQQRFQQLDYLSRLPTMRLPMLATGQYRAFEADGDFTFPGAWLIGQFVRNWFDIADGQFYVLLVQHQGILARRVVNQVSHKGTLLLTADKPNVPNREVALKDVLEVWAVRAFVSQQLPPPAPSYDRIRQLADELRFEVDRLK
ncbi:transcriptional regulator, XRE family [Fibrella aestuarina BUZ 2]|uniref:Transcriptional regulator, XRE family n=2 Tax=Fibrella TaxID=861914 RepID=I0KCI2_9BACT|nr:transcriptional regulator, XRE family [Fibrella aestuarina BUZ 2]